MKIFNWVHKRFHHSTYKDGFASNIKKTETTLNDVDSQALLKQVALGDTLDGWKDGILTIGTLGYDPLSSFNQQREYLALEGEDEPDHHEGDGQGDHIIFDGDGDVDYNVEHEELNPLMHNTFEHNHEDVFEPNHCANSSEHSVVMALNENFLIPTVVSHEITELSPVETDQRKKKGERITLADLFLADSDVKMKMDPAKVLLEPNEKPSLKSKHGLSLAKKLFPLVKDNSHPMKNIQRLMKKMIKKKIHPELDVKNLKPVDREHEEANDSTTLLPV
ncbi:hypothetical protein QN277_023885 [Acacia crassicarpa]|uniref:Protein TILLER ANGLE CONTROL 1 n=1 Tax=Acacia crassicarpa TaxID=499986 RepID=A0AAE1JB12_9FABA|nr:hypothetical protein QN277_023885 [Acacia crassicarpa]